MRLSIALGYGQYEQSIKVGKGAGVCTTFYLSQYDEDKLQEIDFEMSGNCNPGQTPCGTQTVLTCVWWQQKKYLQQFTPLWVGAQPSSMPDTTSGWGKKRVSLQDRLGEGYRDVVGRSPSYPATTTS